MIFWSIVVLLEWRAAIQGTITLCPGRVFPDRAASAVSWAHTLERIGHITWPEEKIGELVTLFRPRENSRKCGFPVIACHDYLGRNPAGGPSAAIHHVKSIGASDVS